MLRVRKGVIDCLLRVTAYDANEVLGPVPFADTLNGSSVELRPRVFVAIPMYFEIVAPPWCRDSLLLGDARNQLITRCFVLIPRVEEHAVTALLHHPIKFPDLFGISAIAIRLHRLRVR